MRKGIADVVCINSDEKSAHLEIHPDNQAKEYESSKGKNNETEKERIGQKGSHGVNYTR
jgi:hypothetical protein